MRENYRIIYLSTTGHKKPILNVVDSNIGFSFNHLPSSRKAVILFRYTTHVGGNEPYQVAI